MNSVALMPLILAGTIGSNAIAACLFMLRLLSCTYRLNSRFDINAHDGVLNLRRSSKLIKEDMSDDDVHDAVLYFAFGMERICKVAISEINPALMLEQSNFSDIVASLYIDRVNKQEASSYSKSTGAKHCTFGELIKRSAIFYDEIYKYKGSLHKLRNFRNILVHQSLRSFDQEDAKKWIFSNFYPLVFSVLTDIGLEPLDAFKENAGKLESLSLAAKYREELEERTDALVKVHKELWDKSRSDVNLEKIQRITNLDLEQPRKHYENSYERFNCPACNNDAVLEIEPDFDFSDGHGFVIGIHPIELRCHFCNLHVTDQEILADLETEDWWH